MLYLCDGPSAQGKACPIKLAGDKQVSKDWGLSCQSCAEAIVSRLNTETYRCTKNATPRRGHACRRKSAVAHRPSKGV